MSLKCERRGIILRNRWIWGILICFFAAGALSSCKSHKSPKESPNVDDVVTIKPPKKDNTLRGKIIEEAKTWIGTPYLYAHKEKGSGTDCSGMVMVVFEEVTGIKLPRNSAKQDEFCETIKEIDILPGDLVFFATGKDKNKVSHVGIMVDKETFIHASSSKGVTISKMATPYYQRTFLRYGRVSQLGKK